MVTLQSVSKITWRKSHSRISLKRLSSAAQALEGLAELTAQRPSSRETTQTVLQREAIALRCMLEDLTVHMRYERLVANISNQLLNLPPRELQQGVTVALAELGQITAVQRAYVFLLSDDGKHLADAYEWTANGVIGHDFDSFRGTPVSTFPWSMAQFQRGETIFVDDPDRLPAQAQAEKTACELLHIVSYVNMPIFAAGELIGWLGFDSVTEKKRWCDEELRFMAIAGDIIANAVQRKRRDELIFRQRELNQRVTSMGTLAAGLAHEINNPLAFVAGNLSYLRDLLDESPTALHRPAIDEMREVVTHAREGAERVRRIVSDLRSLAVGEQTEVGEVDLTTTIDSALRMASNQLRHRATVVRDYAGVPPVRANASQLGQVVLNLLLNAAQALPEDHAAANTITISAHAVGDSVRITVRDTGCGIAADVLPRIFDPFFTTREVGDGMGIGLAISHHLVKSFGGSIEISSEIGQGTAVLVTLPRARVSDRPNHIRPQGHTRRILLVDDEPMVLELLRRVLRGNELVLASNGREALDQIADRSDFDIIFCDVMMPDVTGVDVYTHVRDHHPGVEKRMVFISGGTFTSEMSEFLDQLPNTKLFKPFDTKAVRQLVKSMPRIQHAA